MKSLGEKMFDAFTLAGQPFGPFYWADASPTLQAAWDKAAVAFTARLSPVEPEWFPIGVAPCDGRQILLSAPTWDGVVERDWPNKQAMFRDLADWNDPPTHWTPAPKPPAA